jgi:murein DD-endopeptidase / murein LD-carboxypeptidase
MNSRADVVARARACLGIRFRMQGRDRDGLDCIGLVVASLGIEQVRSDYALRGGSAQMLANELQAVGLRAVNDPEAGDVLVMRTGPGQLHLGIWTGDTLIHSDARLRRVVEWPGDPPWPTLGVWRVCSQGAPSCPAAVSAF